MVPTGEPPGVPDAGDQETEAPAGMLVRVKVVLLPAQMLVVPVMEMFPSKLTLLIAPAVIWKPGLQAAANSVLPSVPVVRFSEYVPLTVGAEKVMSMAVTEPEPGQPTPEAAVTVAPPGPVSVKSLPLAAIDVHFTAPLRFTRIVRNGEHDTEVEVNVGMVCVKLKVVVAPTDIAFPHLSSNVLPSVPI